jgi:hypothetical protein
MLDIRRKIKILLTAAGLLLGFTFSTLAVNLLTHLSDVLIKMYSDSDSEKILGNYTKIMHDNRVLLVFTVDFPIIYDFICFKFLS